MVAKVVAEAIETRLAAIGLPVVGQNVQDGAPADGSAFLLVQYPVTNAEPISVGAPGENLYRDEGGARVVISVPSGSGRDQALDWSDEIIALFRGHTDGHLEFLAPAGGPIDDRNDNGAYFQLTVALPYRFDQFG
ncbi:DUF4128 domain-containing protein [Chenggangzhangella methanolivorans]|uniref:DUF4128 domain-containing protein n=1 Tax=Chenggangzhangella methanolivorans TaxID=1437009 RepID=A0A9E6RA00_9HYPH|nr:DUF4128 domain-containing protein [Chenggangzhangella methanolivorans]QZN99543.1 DUF4128 domain-containing protein [Chenggangzhangella methanolivorans]